MHCSQTSCPAMNDPDILNAILNQAFSEMLVSGDTPCVLIREGIIDWVNDAVEELSGYEKSEILGRNVNDFGEMVNQIDESIVDVENLRQSIADNKKDITESLIFKLIRKQGDIKWVKFVIHQFIRDGEHYAFDIMQDITVIKEREEKFQLLTGLSLVGVLIEQDGLLKYINPAFTSITGFTEDDVKSWEPYKYIDDIYPEDKEIARENAGIAHSNEILSDHSHVVYRIYMKDGNLRWIENFMESGYFNGRRAHIVAFIDVTEKHDNEQRLRESEEKFHIIAEQSALGIAIIQDDKLIYVNNMFADIIGHSPSELLNASAQDYFDMIPDQLRAEIEQRYRERVLGDITDDSKYILPIKTGTGNNLYELSTTIIIINDHSAIMVTAHDVTGLLETQQELKESEEKFRTIAERSIVGIILMQNGLVKYVNEQTSLVYGYSVQEMLGWSSQHLIMKLHPSDRSSIDRFFDDRNEFTDDTVHEATFRIMTRSGDMRWIHAYVNLVPYQGKNAGMIIISDITDRKESELALAQSELKYHQLFEESAEGIILMDHKGTFFECNSMAEKILNFTKKEIVGKNYKDFQQYLVTDLAFFRVYLKKANQGQATEPFDLEAISSLRGTVWLRCTITRINYGKERVNQLVIHNITDKKKLESMLQQENEKLRQLDTMRKNFIFTATHELKTPLVSIYGASDFLIKMMPEKIDENLKHLIDIIHKGAVRLKALVDNMLDASRMDTGNFNLAMEDINMVEVVEQSVAGLDFLVQVSEQEIVQDLPETLIARVDKLRIDQVVTNLLSNAIKNTPKGGHIEIRLSQDENDLNFAIKDNGVGLTKDEMDVLFTQFGKLERTDLNTAINIQGSGLGLFISKNIIEMHRGKIWAESDGRNLGSTFYFSIPIGKSSDTREE